MNKWKIVEGGKRGPGHHLRQGRGRESLPGKVKGFPLDYGDVVVEFGSAGGGVGDPLERDRAGQTGHLRGLRVHRGALATSIGSW